MSRKEQNPWENYQLDYRSTQCNQAAYAIVDQAVAMGRITSYQEALQMKALVEKARQTVNRSDQHDAMRLDIYLSLLEDEVNYALKRHRTFSWQVILGVIVSLFIFNECSNSHEQDAQRFQQQLVNIQAWTSDTTVTYQQMQTQVGSSTDIAYVRDEYKSGAHYKLVELYNICAKINSCDRHQKEEELRLDTASTEKLRAYLTEQIASCKKRHGEYLAEFEEFNSLPLAKLQDHASNYVQNRLDSENSGKAKMRFWFIFFLILTPVYIFASYPYGYQINRQESRMDAVNGIQKLGVWIAGLLFGTGMAINFITIVRYWSNGSVTHEDDGSGPVRLALKVGFFVAAVCVFCFVSCFVMVISTIFGLINFFSKKDAQTAPSPKMEEACIE